MQIESKCQHARHHDGVAGIPASGSLSLPSIHSLGAEEAGYSVSVLVLDREERKSEPEWRRAKGSARRMGKSCRGAPSSRFPFSAGVKWTRNSRLFTALEKYLWIRGFRIGRDASSPRDPCSDRTLCSALRMPSNVLVHPSLQRVQLRAASLSCQSRLKPKFEFLHLTASSLHQDIHLADLPCPRHQPVTTDIGSIPTAPHGTHLERTLKLLPRV